MWTDGVVDVLPLMEGGGEASDAGMSGSPFVKLLGVRAVAAFDATVELRTPGRENEELDATRAAGFLELRHEFTAAIDLEGLHGKGHPVEHRRKSEARGPRCRAFVQLEDGIATDDVAR